MAYEVSETCRVKRPERSPSALDLASLPSHPMTRPWLNSVIRSAVYLYFAAGMALLVSDGMVSVLRYQVDKRFPASFLLLFSWASSGFWRSRVGTRSGCR